LLISILDSKEFRGIYIPDAYQEEVIEVNCPYGNRFFVFQAMPGIGFSSGLGILFALIECKSGSSKEIANYYQKVFDADVFHDAQRALSRVICGDWNQMIFMEKENPLPFTGPHFILNYYLHFF
jgi:hypothetical protein